MDNENPNSNADAHILPRGSRLKNGAYAIGEVLGQGGFGITYKGGDMTLRRYVAIKEFFPSGARRHETRILPPASTCENDHQRTLRNFLEEARTLSRFDHPNIVRVLDAFHDNNTTYMVMELLSGDTLAEQLTENQPLEIALAVEYALQICAALQQVHGGGWLHRDVKPENIVIAPENRAALIDFGTARQSSAFTQRMTQIVTPGYAPLEQYAQNARRAPATDIYALGATLYHLLTGQKPIDATDRAAEVQLPTARELNPRIGRALDAAISAALTMNIIERPQSAAEFAQLLRAALGNQEAEIASVQVLAPASESDAASLTDVAAIPRAIGMTLTLSQQTSRHALGINRLTFSHDGQMLASAGQDKVLNLWNPRMRAVCGVLRAHEAAISSCAFTPDASQIISGSLDGSVRVWDVATRQNITIWQHETPIHALAVHPSAPFLACADENATLLRDLNSGDVVRELEFAAHALAFSPDGRWLAAGGATGWALWEVETRRLCHVGTENVAVKDLAWSQQSVLAAACEDGCLRCWRFEAEGRSELWQELSINALPLQCVAFSNDGAIVGASGLDCIVRLWSVQTGVQLKFHSRHKKRVGSLAFAPQSNLLVSGSSDTNVDFCQMQIEIEA